MVAAREWDLWSTRARLVVTDPAALDRALLLVDDLLADVEVGGQPVPPRLGGERAASGTGRHRARLPDAGRPARRGARRRRARPTAPSTPRSAPRCRRSATTATSELRRERPGLVALVRPVPGWRTRPPRRRRLDAARGPRARPGRDRQGPWRPTAAAALVAERLGVGVLVSLGRRHRDRRPGTRGRLAGPGPGHRGRPRRPGLAAGRLRPRHLQHGPAYLAPRQRDAAPHRRPAHGRPGRRRSGAASASPPAPAAMANAAATATIVKGTRRARLALRPAAARPPRRPRRRGPPAQRLAGRAHGRWRHDRRPSGRSAAAPASSPW